MCWQIAIMVKTQIQIPDHLFKETKRVAKEYEMSFAEVVRRGIERIVLSYPKRAGDHVPWKLPLLESELKKDLEDLHAITADSESDRTSRG